ncbi:MAG: peptidylprolyl isomerase, partial [Rubrivivax sp.]|nr:peptidylprolyl isomerase [Rubrivivax sp.]
PVKTQFGWHIIRLEDTRDAPFPPFADVKDQIKQRLDQTKMQQYQEELRTKAKTDYTFSK